MGEQRTLVVDFLKQCEKEAPRLGKSLAKLEGDARNTLAGILMRFDCDKSGNLDVEERALAIKVLERMHRPSARGLGTLLEVLTYLDLNENNILEFQELSLAVEILELFCKADSVNETLSVKELEMLTAVLKHLDPGGRGVLDGEARNHLRDGLWDPDAFLAEQKASNPLLKKVMSGGGKD